MNTQKLDLINIPLIDRKNLADLRPASAVNKTESLFCQHGAGEEQFAAGAALMTVALTNRNLSLHIPFAEMNQPKPSQFAAGLKDNAGILKMLFDRENQRVTKSG